MKHRITNISGAPVSLPFANGAITLAKHGDSAEIDLPPDRAPSLARHGIVACEAVAMHPPPDAALARNPAPAARPATPANPPPASQPAADEPKETR